MKTKNDNTIRIRIDSATRAMLERKAEAETLTLSAWVRRLLTREARK